MRGVEVLRAACDNGLARPPEYRGVVRHAVIEVVADASAAEYGRHAADVVSLIVSRDEQIDRVDPELVDLKHDSGRRSGIDERSLPAFPDHDCIALTHIKKAELELLGLERKSYENRRKCNEDRPEHMRPHLLKI